MISRKQTAELRNALEPLYSDLAGPDAHEPWRMPLCVDWSWEAVKIARVVLKIENPDLLYRVECLPQPRMIDHFDLPPRHQYLIDVRDEQDPTAIDGTYLQMAHQPAQGPYGHVLVSPLSQLENELENAGVNPGCAFIWRPFTPGPATHYPFRARI